MCRGESAKKKRHYTVKMIWRPGATAPAKKVHFNLNGSELRGFPIKARSGQSGILYANPLAPDAKCPSGFRVLSLSGGSGGGPVCVCSVGPDRKYRPSLNGERGNNKRFRNLLKNVK